MGGGLLFVAVAAGISSAAAGKVEGTFVVAGTDAKLGYVRGARTKLDDKGRTGVAILLPAREATGDTAAWRSAEPSKNGSFLYLILEPSGAVWVAELGHASARSGRFMPPPEARELGARVAGGFAVVVSEAETARATPNQEIRYARPPDPPYAPTFLLVPRPSYDTTEGNAVRPL